MHESDFAESSENTVSPSLEVSFDNDFIPEDDFGQHEFADDGLPSGVLDMITSTSDLATQVTPDLSYDEAVSLNETIKATAEVLYVLVNKAYIGKIWLQLGYNSFKDYVTQELNMSRSRAYQLLDLAKVVEKIEEIAPEGTEISIKEVVARDIKNVIDDLIPEMEKGLAELDDNEDPSDYINAFLKEAQESKHQAERDLAAEATGEFEQGGSYSEETEGDYADRAGFSDSGFDNGGGASGSANGDVYTRGIEDFLGDDFKDSEEIDELFASPDGQDIHLQLESLYSLYNALESIKQLPDAEQVVQWIPVEKRGQIATSFQEVVEWVNNFKDSFMGQEWYPELANALEQVGSEPEEVVSDFFQDYEPENDGDAETPEW